MNSEIGSSDRFTASGNKRDGALHHYCTYFDEAYLMRGLALYRSLVQHDPQARLWVLCLSERCRELLARLDTPRLKLFTLEDLAAEDPVLAGARVNRSLIEYYFTCTAPLMLHVLTQVPAGDLVTYLDADMCFFDDPTSVYAEIGDRSIAIIPHRFPPHLLHLEERGTYNVGWVSIRNDAEGWACARWWRERCVEWCHDVVEPDRYADQKYLNRWPGMFRNVAVLRHKGVNTAPYNVTNSTVRVENGKIWIDEDPLVIFHFHGFRRVNRILYDPNLARYRVAATRAVRREIYGSYIAALKLVRKELVPLLPPGSPYARYPRGSAREPRLTLGPVRSVVNRGRMFGRFTRDVLGGKHILYIGGRVL
jgi:hypothetical protein